MEENQTVMRDLNLAGKKKYFEYFIVYEEMRELTLACIPFPSSQEASVLPVFSPLYK